jgi:hypothetical protein
MGRTPGRSVVAKNQEGSEQNPQIKSPVENLPQNTQQNESAAKEEDL